MAVYQVTFHQRIDDYAVVQTLTEPDLDLGLPFTLAGLGHSLNGTHNVYALPPYLFTGVDSQGDLMFNYQVPITKFCFTTLATIWNEAPLFRKAL